MNVQNFILPSTMVKGDIIPMKVSQEGHWNNQVPSKIPDDTAQNFSEAFSRALQEVNSQLVESDSLTQKMIEDPEKVNIHSVLIAGEKARMSLTYTKTIMDLAVKTYRDLVNLR